MRKFIYAGLLLTILLVLNGCNNNSKNINKSIVDVNKGIEKIQMISAFPFTPTKFTEDKEKIHEIVSYMNDLDLKASEEKREALNIGYVITVFYDDTTYKEYYVVGEKYFEYGKYRYEITKEQAQKFKDFYYSLINSENK